VFVINPDKYLLPDYKISPFQTSDIAFNNSIPPDTSIDAYFEKRFGHTNFYYTLTGRQALNEALCAYQLHPNDVVTIFTTTGNFYISTCVTSEIEKFCQWNREVNDRTKVILVIHEFGYPFQTAQALKKYNLPIIEDCAYSFFSEADDYKVGEVGDFAIYSFPKMFPIQIGGLLVANNGLASSTAPNTPEINYIKNVLSHQIKQKHRLIATRLKNYEILKQKLAELGFEPRFDTGTNAVPGVFMFKSGGSSNLLLLKEYLVRHGIQCSVFYGEEAFFIPVHQALHATDLSYMVQVIQSFLR
jgi:hypothetical protein